jgi:NAD(P)-dependent dehydrogenase (short-subunit alcohol dehydrogenase family)
MADRREGKRALVTAAGQRIGRAAAGLCRQGGPALAVYLASDETALTTGVTISSTAGLRC